MKKIFTLLFLAAILYVGYLAVTMPRDGESTAIENMQSGADEIVNQVTDMYEEYGSAAAKQVDQVIAEKVEQADETLEQITGQADEAIEEAAHSALEGAKQGFIRSLKESANEFWDKLTDEGSEE